MLGAREHALDHRQGGGRVVLGDPIINAFEIGKRQIVEDKLHAPSRLMRARASSCESSLRSGRHGGGGFRKLLVGDAQVFPVRQIVEHGDGGGVLLAVRQLLDLFERIAKKFGHGISIANCETNSTPVKPGNDDPEAVRTSVYSRNRGTGGRLP